MKESNTVGNSMNASVEEQKQSYAVTTQVVAAIMLSSEWHQASEHQRNETSGRVD